MTCSNNPSCTHLTEDHDHDPLFGDGPHCRVIGCWCGHDDPERGRRLDLALLRIGVERGIARKTPVRLFPINPC